MHLVNNKNIIDDKIHEECGIFGGYCQCGNIAPYIKCALLKLQHRGQESAGLCAGDKKQTLYKNTGLVSLALNDAEIKNISGSFGIGHVRYSTFGGDDKENIQPFKVFYMGEDVSLAHNGNIPQAHKIREKLKQQGEKFSGSSDSEIILKSLIFSLKKKPSEWSFDEVAQCLNGNFPHGAYCVILYTKERVMAFRDAFGYRPLMFARCKQGDFIASEDVGFFGLDIERVIEIAPGQGVEITCKGYEVKTFAKSEKISQCVFEQIYFASAASNIFSKSVYAARYELGKILAKCEDKDFSPDVAFPVPDSGLACAIGYCEALGVPFCHGLIRNVWMERSFIQPQQNKRNKNVRLKFIPVKSEIEGKKIVLIDDSLVRGTTSSEIVKMLKSAGAAEVHMRSVSPKIINNCLWGVDIPTKEELISYNKTDKQIAKQIGADSVKFLPLERLSDVFEGEMWCKKCFINTSADDFVNVRTPLGKEEIK